MLRNNTKREINGQIILEYAMVLGAIILAMFAMSTMIKRGSQSMIRTVADQVGNQLESDQRFDDTGHLVSSYTASRATSDKQKNEFVGNTTFTISETIHTDSNALINLGFTEEYN